MSRQVPGDEAGRRRHRTPCALALLGLLAAASVAGPPDESLQRRRFSGHPATNRPDVVVPNPGTVGPPPACILAEPLGAIPEGEPCDDRGHLDRNCGCHCPLDGARFTEVACGDTVAGTAWVAGGRRDHDWLRLETTAPCTSVALVLTAGFEARLGFASTTNPGSGRCAEMSLLDPSVRTDGCGTASVVVPCLPAGRHLVLVASDDFDLLPCDPRDPGANAWVLSIACAEDCDAGAIVPACPGRGDLDGDAEVGFDDMVMLLAWWGPCDAGACPLSGDLDGDGLVGFEDMLALFAGWGPCPAVELDGDGADGCGSGGVEGPGPLT